MKKLLKILGVLFIIFVGLIITAVILVKIYLPPEKVKALLLSRIGESLKREVDIQDLSVSIFKGVSVEGFKISESPTFQEGTFVSSKSFIVKYNLLSILKRQLSISMVTLEEPLINITRNPDGSFNFSDLIKASPPGEEKEALPEDESQTGNAPAIALLVSKAQLKDGQLNFTDHSPAAMSVRAHKINLVVSDISLVSPMDISFSTSIEHKNMGGDISFDGKLDLNKGILEIGRLSPSYADLSIDITGLVEDFKEKPKLNISIKDKKVMIDSIANIFPLPEGLKLNG
ncbi:AsmA family protein, partial [bacterium]|nr:AsmA family protein [bacterium]